MIRPLPCDSPILGRRSLLAVILLNLLPLNLSAEPPVSEQVPDWFEREVAQHTGAAEAGDPESQYHLARTYDDESTGFRDASKALYWYTKAAEQGHTEAQSTLATGYTLGVFGPKDERKAFYWRKKAASGGDAFSQCQLGDDYVAGSVTPRNYDTAVAWYRRSIEGGYFLAPQSLAKMYEEGLGVEQSLVQAYAWNSLSAATGNIAAGWYQDELEKRMSPSQIKEAQRLAADLHERHGARLSNP